MNKIDSQLSFQKLAAIVLFLCSSLSGFGQGFFSGSFQSNTNFFVRDSSIGAAGLPHYDNYKIGTEAWLNLNYNNEKYGLDIGARVDMFYNTIIFTPTVPYTGAGIGNFYIKKKIKELTITAGYFYEQFGSGIAFRAYEERSLGIDNAILGARAEYNILDKVRVKGFVGVQKNKFTIYKPIIAGLNAEGNFTVKEKLNFIPGLSVVTRSMDQESMNPIVANIEKLDTSERFVPKYNTYIFGAYNTVAYKDFSLYLEGAFKTREAVVDDITKKLVNRSGNVEYVSANYSHQGFGVTLQFKRTDYFIVRTSPNETLLNGMISFLPPTARQNSLRLPARYFAQSLPTRDLAFAGEATYAPNKKLKFTLNGSLITDHILKQDTQIPNKIFFIEGFADADYRISSKIDLDLGFQFVQYNGPILRGDGPTNIRAYTPFLELTTKFTKRKSLRIEVQYQNVKNDYGQWIYALAEFNIAPKWSFAVSDMWNFKPNPEQTDVVNHYQHHYYSVFASFTHHANRITLNYVKQVEGIVCTGGVCRFEPAFSGVKLTLNTTF